MSTVVRSPVAHRFRNAGETVGPQAGWQPHLQSRQIRFVLTQIPSFHLNLHTHPRMDAALKAMLPFGQIGEVNRAALKNASLRHSHSRKAANTFGSSVLSRSVESGYEAATELCDLGESVRLAALVDYADRGAFLDLERVRFEVPAGIRSSSGRLAEQLGQGGECSERNVLTEVGPKRGIEGGWIALVQFNHLRHARMMVVVAGVRVLVCVALRKGGRRAGEDDRSAEQNEACE